MDAEVRALQTAFGLEWDQVQVGILSDTHGWIDPQVRQVLADADYIVHAGDVLEPEVLETSADLAKSGQVLAVAGNNDYRASLRSWELPRVAEIRLPGGLLVVTHGDDFGAFPEHALLRRNWPQARAIVYGHTHRLTCDQEAAPWVLNPGAAGRTRLHEGPSCLMLTAQESKWVVHSYRFASSQEH